MIKKLLLSIMCATAVTAGAQTKLTSTQMTALKAGKSYGQVSVHDPSIYYDKNQSKFYVIGSHLGIGSSSNLSDWSSINTGTNHSTLLGGKAYWDAFNSCPTHEVQVKNGTTISTKTLPSFNAGDYCSIYAVDRTSWIGGDMWAPDVVWNPNMNKYCMYLSLNGDSWASVIVLLTSDYPDRGFTYEAPIVFSGFNNVAYKDVIDKKTEKITRKAGKVDYKNTDLSLVTGSTTLPSRYSSVGDKWGEYYPNCIDPNVLIDKDGEMWLAYGSWSGGIWMLKLDKNTGLRDYTYTYTGTTADRNAASDQYFGKKIAGGYYVSGEGPYIRYINGYYYLFMSYGYMSPGINDKGEPCGGYEMRIFRSTSPTGPYKDAIGNSAIYTSYQLNYGNTSQTNRGMRILGAMKGWAGFDTANGEQAQGHNSAIVDKDGNAFVVYHTKLYSPWSKNFDAFEIRVQQLFQNEYGWLCASPFRYTKATTTQTDIETKRLFTTEQVVGTYKFIMHPYKLDWVNWEMSTPMTVQLNADGTITGDKTGTWEFTKEGKSYVKLKIGTVLYYGVAIQQQDYRYADMPSLCITATSNSGVPVWLYAHNGKAALADAYDAVKSWIQGPIAKDAPAFTHVNAKYETYNYATKELEPETVSPDGKYTPTEDGHKVAIIANVTSTMNDFYFTVGSKYASAVTVPANYVYPVSAQQTTTAAWWTNFSKKDYILKADQVMTFRFYNNNDGGTANYRNWCLYGANATHGASNYTEYFGLRNDNWDNTSGSNTGCTSDFDWNTFVSDMNGSYVDMVVGYTAAGVFTMNATITTTAGKEYHYSYTKTISAKPAQLTLFFVNEGSHIASAMPGDADADGELTKADITLIVNEFLGLKPAIKSRVNADFNKDGKITMQDANSVVNK